MWLTAVILIVLGQQWHSVAQRNKIYQAWVGQMILVRGINSVLVLVFSWHLLMIRKKSAYHQSYLSSIPVSGFKHGYMGVPACPVLITVWFQHFLRWRRWGFSSSAHSQPVPSGQPALNGRVKDLSIQVTISMGQLQPGGLINKICVSVQEEKKEILLCS